MTIYALTGTPGTGKTTVSKKLSKIVIHLSDLYKKSSNKKNSDGEWLVDFQKMKVLVQKEIEDDIVIEGHFAHLMDNIEQIIVLRCNPRELRKRMEERDYNEDKIKEKIEAEAIGLILSESIDYIGKNNVIQLDTSNTDVESISNIIGKYLDGKIKVEEEIDYSERILDWY